MRGRGRICILCSHGGDWRAQGAEAWGRNEVALEIQRRYAGPDEAEADIRVRVAAKEVIIGFGHPVYTISDPRSEIVKGVARELAEAGGDR